MNSPQPNPGDSPGQFDFGNSPSNNPRYRRPQKPAWQSPLVIGGAVVLLAGAAAIFFLPRFAAPPPASAKIRPLKPVTVAELTDVRVSVEVDVTQMKRSSLRYALGQAPRGMAIDPQTGQITWQPSEDQGPGQYQVELFLTAVDKPLDQQTLEFEVTEVVTAPALSPVPRQMVLTGELLQIPLLANDADVPATALAWHIVDSPAELPAELKMTAKVTNTLSCQPAIDCPPGSYEIIVRVQRKSSPDLQALVTIPVVVQARMSPFEQMRNQMAARGHNVKSAGALGNGLFNVPAETLLLPEGRVDVYLYESGRQIDEELQTVSATDATIAGKKIEWAGTPHFFRDDQFLAVYEGDNPNVLAALKQQFGAVDRVLSLKPVTEPMPETPAVDPLETRLLQLYTKNKQLFHPDAYPELRKLYADEFAKAHDAEIQQALGDDYRPMLAWFAEHPGIQEEFYTAILPDVDNLTDVFRLFNALRLADADQLAAYGETAIAIAVCWDQPRGVYNFTGHQRRTKSLMPAQLADALGNFQYLVDAEKFMQGRAKFLPWEFQLYLVNHNTPTREREWAIANYLPQRPMIGKCYSQVPYDTVMLETSSRECKLMGKEYNLPNIKTFGGVCAMQADFASRVGKSLGVPAAYVGGENRFGDLHAWVMWVELQSVTKQGIRFTLESHGRYRGDRYYVGTLTDPQTGKRITDRQLEHRLQSVGSGPLAHRQARLVMRALSIIERNSELSLAERFDNLKRVIRLSPGSREAWEAMGKLSETPDINTRDKRLFAIVLNEFFKTFANYPDFTWEVFNSLIAYEDDATKQIQFYARLNAMYEAAARPDLASKARLKLTELLVAEERLKDATQGLAVSIIKFADEGRFVVTLLDKLEELAAEVDGSDADLARFYVEFLKKIPRKRGNTPSEYCIKMYRRGIAKMQALNQPNLAGQLQVELTRIEAGQ